VDSFIQLGSVLWRYPHSASDEATDPSLRPRLRSLRRTKRKGVVFLAQRVRRLHLFVRRSLTETMSSYLIERILALSNVELHVGSEISSLAENDQSGLVATIKNHDDSSERIMEFRRVFMFIGADPHVDWLQSAVKTDDKGFILTGSPFDPATAADLGREALHLETNLPNVFAIGDVRSGSTKRVAAAVGEGAAVVSLIHGALHPSTRAERRAVRCCDLSTERRNSALPLA
jgi:thioredoxin reductase (NADPH)